MIQLSLPMMVLPPPWSVPRFIVQYSRMTLWSPISSMELLSLLNFLSWGSSPMEQNWNIPLDLPILVGPLITTCEPIQVSSPIVTSCPITEYGPIETFSPIRASRSEERRGGKEGR